jgi:hypothetical protein
MRESLSEFVNKFKPTLPIRAIEIGVMSGANSQIIYNELVKLGLDRLILIDTWSIKYRPEMHTRLLETVMRFEEHKKVTIIRDDSISASDLIKVDDIDYIYLDNIHSYDHVQNEISRWWPKVRAGGMLAGHDINMNAPDRVLKAVKEFCLSKRCNFQTCKNRGEAVEDWWIWKQ